MMIDKKEMIDRYGQYIIIVLIAFTVSFIYLDWQADSNEIQNRIDQCKNNNTLSYPEDNRPWYQLSNYIGYGGINIMYPCNVYRNSSTTLELILKDK